MRLFKAIVSLAFISASRLYAQTDSVTITEVMFNPNSTNTEFVEIFNFGSTSIDLSGWRIYDYQDVDTLKDFGQGIILGSKQFAVIFESDYDTAAGIYKNFIPATALILKVNDTQIGNALGNTGDNVILIRAIGDTLSKYTYTSTNSAGISDEKINVTDPSNAAPNWADGKVINGTPGNYPELDLSIKKHRLTFNPAGPPTGTTVGVTTTINNAAIRTADSFKVKFYEDLNQNHVADNGEELDSITYNTAVNFGDSVTASIASNSLSSGKHIFIAQLSNISPDADTSIANNTVIDSVSTVAAMDLSVITSSLAFSPLNPKVGNNVQVRAKVKNVGLTAVNSFTIKFYEDLNRNLNAEVNEFLDSLNFGILNIADSVIASINVNSATLGWHSYLAKIIASSVMPFADEVSSNDQQQDSVNVTLPDSVTITEVMFKPLSGDNTDEFIELYNYSSQPVDLFKWRIRDNNALDTVTSTGSGTILASGQFAVVFDAGYDLVNGLYKDVLPPGALRLKAHSGNIGNGLGNSLDSLHLINALGDTVSRYSWSVSSGFPSGISHEKIIANNDNSPSNWASSLVTNGTPGFENSITPANLDLSVASSEVVFSPSFPALNQTFSIFANVRNLGLLESGSFTVDVLRISGTDTTSLRQIGSTGLPAGDSLGIGLSDTAHSGRSILVRINYPSDQRSENNTASRAVLLGAARSIVLINEINYSPSSGFTEWIELYNPGPDSIDLNKWKIADGNSDQTNFAVPHTITTVSNVLHSGEFAVVGKDATEFDLKFPNVFGKKFFISGFPALNNTGDMVGLFDSVGAIVDSLLFESQWGGATDVSLERIDATHPAIDPHNWGSSIASAGATPGKINSLTPVPLDLAILKKDISFSPAHPALNEPVTIQAIVRNIGLQNVSTPFSVRIYYDANKDSVGQFSERLDSTAFTGLNVGDSLVLLISWQTPLSKVLVIDARKILVEVDYAGDEKPDNNVAIQDLAIGTKRETLVVNEIMYDPDTTQSEFVEIYNRSSKAVNLKNWKISDASSGKLITVLDRFILPQNYVVLSGDSNFTAKFAVGLSKDQLTKIANIPDSSVIFVKSMPSLNNTDDGVILSDEAGSIVDSVHYDSKSWGGRKGYSLERVSIGAPANDPGNWAASLSASKASPGAVNGILLAQPFAASSLIINEIMYSPLTNEPEYIEIYNPGISSISLFRWAIQMGNSKVILVDTALSVAPKTYLVVAENSKFPSRFEAFTKLIPTDGFPSLSNSGALVTLRDWVGTVIDSVHYLPSWGGGEGTSLERISTSAGSGVKTNWGSCVFLEGGTPGKINSLFAGAQSSKIKISPAPNPFFVDRGELTKIVLELPITQSRVTMKIYDNQGRLIRTLLNNSPTGSYREVMWDGKDKDNQFARIGIYIIYVEAISENSGFTKSAKKTVVLGRNL